MVVGGCRGRVLHRLIYRGEFLFLFVFDGELREALFINRSLRSPSSVER